MRPDAASVRADKGARAGWSGWRVVGGLLPLVLLAALVGAIARSGPAELLRGDDYPPVERLSFQRVELRPEGIVADVLNDGPDSVTIAQVQVDEAYWQFSSEAGRQTLNHLEQTTLTIPYPWVHGEAHVVRLVTATGLTFEHEIAVAVATPRPGVRFFGIFTLIGVYVGVVPVAIGLLWFPWVVRLRRTGLDFLLALTVGLLLFLLVDATREGLEAAAGMPASYQGVALFVFAAVGAYLGLDAFGGWLRARRPGTREGEPVSAGEGAWILALLIATGIGLHNFGEGLAIGSAFALGEAALGTLLIIGFTLHNTTEGLAIVAPLARVGPTHRVGALALVRLGAIGGLPTIAGAWLGGFVYSPVWSVVFLAVGVGAIAQVVVQITRQMATDRPLARYLAGGPVMGGLATGFVVMYATGMLIG